METTIDQAVRGDLLRHVPRLDFGHDLDCRQAAGFSLPIVVINLAHRTDRWQAISTRMAAGGLDNLIKMPAVAGAALPADAIADLVGRPAEEVDGTPRSHLALTRPAIGCFLSHLAIWQWVIESGHPRVLVFEDDAQLAPGYDADRLARFIASLGPGHELVFPGQIIMAGLADLPADNSPLARLYYFNGTFAYLITPTACRLLLQRLVPLKVHIDHQISSVLVAERLRFAAHYASPSFFEPDWSLRSDCYVPITDETSADSQLATLFDTTRRMLLAEGRPLLAA